MTATPENGGTQFSVKRGKVQLRWDWAIRAVSLLLLCGANAQIYLTREFISREEYAQRETAIGAVQTRLTDLTRCTAELQERLRSIEERLKEKRK
jgi:hypothetical protein